MIPMSNRPATIQHLNSNRFNRCRVEGEAVEVEVEVVGAVVGAVVGVVEAVVVVVEVVASLDGSMAPLYGGFDG